jgi:hypothetical protein
MGTLHSQTGKLAAVLLIGLAVSLAISSFIGRNKDHIAHASGNAYVRVNRFGYINGETKQAIRLAGGPESGATFSVASQR